jgi:TolB-like protein/DNA-binding winged helix-turn-helix (wHTH) protein/Tfp pilus assembly protein PilF
MRCVEKGQTGVESEGLAPPVDAGFRAIHAVMPITSSQRFQFGDGYELDLGAYELRRDGRALRLPRIPMEVLRLLIEQRGNLVTREEIIERIWGREVFVDTDNSINAAVRKIRQVLNDDADEPDFIQTIPAKGYRFVALVTEMGLAPGNSSVSAEAAATAETMRMPEGLGPDQIIPDRTSPPQIGSAAVSGSPANIKVLAWQRWAIGSAIALLLVTAIAIYAGWFRRQASLPPATRVMLAVLPFENLTGDPGQEYFSDGLTEEMISQLGDLDPTHLGVIARTSVMHYKHSQDSIPQIGKDLGVQYVIEGSVRRDSERVRITAQLIQVKDQSHLWAREYDRDLGHLLQLQAEIAREVANEIEFSLSGRRPIEAAREAVGPAGANSYEAYDQYLKGRYFWNKRTADGFRQAADYFQQAIDKDPNYGRAYAGLADTFTLMTTWYIGPQSELMPKARTAALRALELDESLAEAHASLALIKENYDYDWAGAEKEFRRAIQLGPQYASAHQWYAEFLSWQGRFEEAFAESERARQLDPLSPIIAADYASILYNSRQYDSAVRQCLSVLDLDPNFHHARDLMIPSYLQLGKYDAAVDEINRWAARDQGPWVWATRAAVYSRLGHAEEARRELMKIEHLPGSRADRTPTLLVAYSGTGQNDRVIELLQRAYSEHSNAVVQIKVDPMYDPIRSDPRFRDLLRRVGLEQ